MNLMLLSNPIATTKAHSSKSMTRQSYALNPKDACDACGQKSARLFTLKIGKQKAKLCSPCLSRFWQMQNPVLPFWRHSTWWHKLPTKLPTLPTLPTWPTRNPRRRFSRKQKGGTMLLLLLAGGAALWYFYLRGKTFTIPG